MKCYNLVYETGGIFSMLKKSKIIIACILSVFIVALTGTGLWLFLDAGTGGGNTPGTTTPDKPSDPDKPQDIVYQETNVQRFADVLDKLTKLDNVDPSAPAAGTTYAALGEIKRAYCKQAAYAFSDSGISAESFYKVIEFVEGLIDEEGFVGFKGTELEGSTILEAYGFNIKRYIDFKELKEYISALDYDKIASYLVTKFSNLVSDMKGGSLAVSTEAGTIRKILDLFFEYTGVKEAEVGKIVYYSVDRLFATIQDKKVDVENMVNKVLVSQIKKGGKAKEAVEELMKIFSGSFVDIDLSKLTDNQIVAMVEVAVDSWFTSFVAPAKRTWNNMGVDKVATSVNGMLTTTFGIFNSLNSANLNMLNQVLQQFSKTIVDAETDEAREAAMVGAIESLTGLAQAKASEIRANRTLLEDGTYTSLYVDENMLNFVKQLENKFIPIAYALSSAGYFNFDFLKIGLAGGTVLETVELLTNITTNGILNVLDLIGEKDNKGEYSFARQIIQVFVERQKTLGPVEDGGRTIDITDKTSLLAGINKLIDMFEDYKKAEFISDTYDLYVGTEGTLTKLKTGVESVTTVDAELQKDASIAIKEAIMALAIAPIVGGVGDNSIMSVIQTVIGPIFGDDKIAIPSEFPVSTLPEYKANGGEKTFETNHAELAIIVKMLTSFLSGKGVEITTIINRDDATKNQSYTLRENGLSGCISNGSVYGIIEQIISYYMVSKGAISSLFSNYGHIAYEVTGASTAAKYYPTIKEWFDAVVSKKYYFYYVNGEDFVKVYFKNSVEEEEVRIFAAMLDDSGIASETTIKSAYLRYGGTVLTRTGETGLTEAQLYAQIIYKLFESIPKSKFVDSGDDRLIALYNAYIGLSTTVDKLQQFINMYNDSETKLNAGSYSFNAYALGSTLNDVIAVDNLRFNGTAIDELLRFIGQYNALAAKGNTTSDQECKQITLNKMQKNAITGSISIELESLELYIADENEKVGFSVSNAMLNSFIENDKTISLIISMIDPVIQALASGFGVEYVKGGVKSPIDLTLKLNSETGSYTNETFKEIFEQLVLPIMSAQFGVNLTGTTFAERKASFIQAIKDQIKDRFNIGAIDSEEKFDKRQSLLNKGVLDSDFDMDYDNSLIKAYLNAGDSRKRMILATWFENSGSFNASSLTFDQYKGYVIAYMNKFANNRYSNENAYYARYSSECSSYWNYVDSNSTTDRDNIIQTWYNNEKADSYRQTSLIEFMNKINNGYIGSNYDSVTQYWGNTYVTASNGSSRKYWSMRESIQNNYSDLRYYYNIGVDKADLEAWWYIDRYASFSPAYAAYYNAELDSWIGSNQASFATKYGDTDLYKEYIDLSESDKTSILNEICSEVEKAYDRFMDGMVEYAGPNGMNVLRYADAVTPVLFYFFEIPQEAGNGNTRLSQVATAALSLIIPYIVGIIGSIGH